MLRKFFAMLLALSLLAGCGTASVPSNPESPVPSSEPASVPGAAPEAPTGPERPDGILPQEDTEYPGNLAGAQLYYAPGHRLTLYAMEPGTGALRVVRENDFWNGRKVECVSPSGNRLLLYSEDGAPTRRVAGLSVYDIEKDILVNLDRTIEDPYGNWEESHWFPALGKYAFVDEDTFYYLRPCYREDPERPHLHRYDIGEDGTVTASFLELECQGRKETTWESDCVLLPEKGEMFTLFYMGEGSEEWFTWDIDTGKLLSRTPGNNLRGGDYYLDGVFYTAEMDSQNETFVLTAYDMDTDTLETLTTGVMHRSPGMENETEIGRGVLETVWVREVRDGKVLLRSRWEESLTPSQYREFLWDPAVGGEIVFGELLDAPAFPVEDSVGYTPIFTIFREGEGLFLPVPQGLAEQYQEPLSGQPYPLAVLSGGELLFLAKNWDIA